MASNNNFGVSITANFKDKVGDKIKKLQKDIDEAKKKNKEFNNENKKTEDQASKTTMHIDKEAKAFNNLAKSQANAVKEQSKLKQFMKSSTGQIVGALGGAFAVRGMWTQMRDWDTYRRKIQGITHESDVGMAKLDAKIIETGQKYGQSIVGLQHTAFGLTRTWSHGTEEITKNLEELTKSAIATSSSIETVADVYLPLKQQFGDLLPQDVMNAVIFAGDRATMTMEQFRETVSDAAIASKSANQNINTMMGTLVVLGKSGIKGGEAGTAVRNIFQQMSNPAFRKQFKALGVDFDNINIKNKNFVESLSILKTSIDKIRLQKGGANIVDENIIKIFGSRYSNMFNMLLKNVEDVRNQEQESMKFIKDDLGSGIVKRQIQGVANGAARLSASFEALTLKFNTSIAPFIAGAMEGLLSGINFLESAITSLAKPFDEIGKAVLGAIGGIGVGGLIGGAVGAMLPIPGGARIGMAIGGALGGAGGGKVGYEQGLLNRQDKEASQTMLAKTVANKYGSGMDYFGAQMIKQSPSSLDQTLVSKIPSIPNQTMTNINLVIEDKAGIKANIKNVNNDNKGKVAIKQQGGMDYTNF